MDENFQTELQDNSAIEVAEQLLRFYRYCVEGNESLALEEREKLPLLQPWILSRDEISRRQNNRAPINNTSSSDSDGENENTMEVTPDASDDWVEVKTRRKK